MYTDLNKLFKSSRQVTTLGASLFGDKVNLYTGALEFVQTDVSLPGNSRLPVSVGRRLVTGQNSKDGLFGAWDLEIPHLHGVYQKIRGWVPLSGNVNERCSDFSQPAYEEGSYGSLSGWEGTEFWHGSFLYIPGTGDQELLRRSPTNTIAPLGNSYPIVTRNNWQIRCLASMDPSNGEAGQAFIAVSPDGTEYRFDWMVSRPLPNLTKASAAPELSLKESASSSLSVNSISGGTIAPMAIGGNALARKEVWILPTKITDRFGNSVTYTYDTVNKWQLQRIVSTSESGTPRQITFNYLTPGSTTSRLVSSVSDGTRTWTYRYGGADGRGPLASVTLPDNSTWQLEELEKLARGIAYIGNGDCEAPGKINSSTIRAAQPTRPEPAANLFWIQSGMPGLACHTIAANTSIPMRPYLTTRTNSIPSH